MKWFIILIFVLGPNYFPISNGNHVKKTHKKFSEPLYDLVQPLDTLSLKLKNLGEELDKL